MFCPECGKENKNEYNKYCAYCGNELPNVMSCNGYDTDAPKNNKNKWKTITIIILAVAGACVAVYFAMKLVIIPNGVYNDASALMDTGKYEEAIDMFETLDGYKDSAEQIEICETAILDVAYEKARDLMNAGDYEDAIVAFENLYGYKDSAEKIEFCKTNITTGTGESGTEESAAEESAAEESAAEESAAEESAAEESAASGTGATGVQAEQPGRNGIEPVLIGDVVLFGEYEQDNNVANGIEDIEWLVLDTEDDKVLVISQYALDCRLYNAQNEDMTWDDCTLRDWLNDEFLNNAFSDDEQSMIPEVTVAVGENRDYNTDPGEETTDKVFLLSLDEAKKYFASNETRKCLPTEYALAQGAYTNSNSTVDGKASCWWWLRSPGYYQFDAAFVDNDGLADSVGDTVDSEYVCIRPVMWINLAS